MADGSRKWHLDLDRVQELARLELDAHERTRLEDELHRILRFASEMGKSVDGSGADDSPEPTELRGDEPSDLEASRWQTNAPDLREGWFVVPDPSDRS